MFDYFLSTPQGITTYVNYTAITLFIVETLAIAVAGQRIVGKVAADIALETLGRVAGAVPKIGAIVKSGADLIDKNKKFYDMYDDYSTLPDDARKLGRDLNKIGQSSNKRRKQ